MAAKFFEIVENGFNTINHILIGFITIYLTFISSQTTTTISARSWHVLLCTWGYQLLMAEGIIALAPGNIWTYLVSRRTKILLHWVLQVIGAAFSIVGIWMEYKGRRRHLNNMHEMLGFVSMVFMCITIVNGLANLYNQELSKWIKPVYQKAVHNILGITTFVLGMVSIYYSYTFRWTTSRVPATMCRTLEILTVVTLVLSLFAALRAFYLQMKQILSKDE